MLKIKSILVSLLAVAALASCSKENDESPEVDGGKDYDVAYVSISLSGPKKTGTRASGEKPSLPEESEIKQLYVITFNSGKTVVKDTDPTAKYATVLSSGPGGSLNTTSGGVTTPNTPIKVATNTEYLLVIANPGDILKARLESISASTTYDDINQMLTVATKSGEADNSYLVEEVAHTNGFTMINAGFYTSSTTSWEDDCLLNVADKIVQAKDYKTDNEALNAAKSNPASLKIERLASKLEVMVKGVLEVAPFEDPSGNSLGQFEFGNWTIDYYNSLFFPFAKKTTTKSSHATGFYESNFYTIDPNFTKVSGSEYLTGIVKNVVDPSTREPNADWAAKGVTAGDKDNDFRYCIENTMDAGYQKFGAATRLVLKGKYAPWPAGEFTLGNDWFRLPNGTNSKNFKSFDDLKTAYDAAKLKETNVEPMDATERLLVSACELFYTLIKSELSADPGSFAALTAAELSTSNITNGGELAKQEGCIYWYQNSLNYYYYEIGHDNEATDHMEYGKYGVVRNNFYTLTLAKVNGNGTPWYPDDEDDEEDIDKLGAYLHFEIEVAPWVYWTTEFEI